MTKVKIEPYLMSVLAKRFELITNQMTNTLLRTARSGVVNTARDFSCSIVDWNSQLVVVAEGLPIHVASSGLVAEVMTEYFPDLKKGDCFLNNSPYHGNTHHADYTFSVPVFYKGEHLFTTIARAHQADCGNSQPTTYMPFAQDIYEEGALSFPCVRIQRDYEDIEDIIRMAKSRIRIPEQWYGDYLAAVGACRIGEREIEKLCNKYGVEIIKAFIDQWQEYGERSMTEAIQQLPSGTWKNHTVHDPLPGIAPEGINVHLRMTVDSNEGTIELDFTESDDSVQAGLNLSEATVIAAATSGVMNSLDANIPSNEGAFRRIKLKIRENCIVGIAKIPQSASMATTNIADRVINVVQSCFAQLGANIGMAEGALGMPASAAVISGVDWRMNDAPFVNQIILGLAGGPAVHGHDGWFSYGIPVTGGVLHSDSVEIDEQRYPIMIDKYEYITDSGGVGQWQGAPGVECHMRPRKNPAVWVYPNDGHFNPPKGVLGGGSGGKSDVWKYNVNDHTTEELPKISQEVINSDEVIVSVSCGGGGYGNPLKRDMERVLSDTENGYVSIERARNTYGVVIESNGKGLTVNKEKSKQLRKKLKSKEEK